MSSWVAAKEAELLCAAYNLGKPVTKQMLQDGLADFSQKISKDV